MDRNTSFQDIKNIVDQFVRERDWVKFHSPKNLSMALSIEAAELMEHFQWLTVEESTSLDTSSKGEVGEEMADIASYLFALASVMDIDLSSAIVRKMEKNRIKYPISEFKGRYGIKDDSAR